MTSEYVIINPLLGKNDEIISQKANWNKLYQTTKGNAYKGIVNHISKEQVGLLIIAYA